MGEAKRKTAQTFRVTFTAKQRHVLCELMLVMEFDGAGEIRKFNRAFEALGLDEYEQSLTRPLTVDEAAAETAFVLTHENLTYVGAVCERSKLTGGGARVVVQIPDVIDAARSQAEEGVALNT